MFASATDKTIAGWGDVLNSSFNDYFAAPRLSRSMLL
jgi:hypothetical protein